MKFFANRNIWKKIVIVLSLIFSMSFVKPAPVNASLSALGGELMEPICDLLVWFGDGILGVTHSMVVHQETTIIRVDLNNALTKVKRVLFTVGAFLLVLVAAAAIIVTGAIAIGAVAAALSITASTFSIGVTIAASVVPVAIKGGIYFGAKVWTGDSFDNEIALPLYSISPELIFSNTIPLFDVNFFNPNSKPYKYEWIHKKDLGVGTNFDDEARANGKFIKLTKEEEEKTKNFDFVHNGKPAEDETKKYLQLGAGDTTLVSAKKAVIDGKTYIQYVRWTQMTKEEVMADKSIDAEEAGTYSKTFTYRLNDGTGSTDSGSGETEKSGEQIYYGFSYELANTIKFWYSIIKTLAIVGMMSVLVYIGIRILLSSTAEQQAKQKKLFGDWLVGMVLLFTMQYIMIFSNIAVDHLTEMFRSINPMGQVAFIPDADGLVERELNRYNIQVSEDPDQVIDDSNMVVYKFQDIQGNLSDAKEWYIEWHTDLMGHLRIALQANKNSVNYIGYTIMFLVMVIYTGIFIFIYIKRVIYMAFLTVIAPLVALTYPIDKANDGSAQGFNYWFKEYIFNLLLQPVHLLTYTILVSTAIKFATTHWIYSLVVLGFITQAEKIVRQMFNFSKANTPGIFAGPAGAALAMSGMRWLMGRGPNGGPRGGKISGGKGSNSDDDIGLTSTGENKVKVNGDSLARWWNGDSDSTQSVPTAILGEGDNNNSTASIIDGGDNGASEGNSLADNSSIPFSRNNNDSYQDADFWDNYGTDVYPYEDDSIDQIWDQPWDYEDTGELIDGNGTSDKKDFNSTGDNPNGDSNMDNTDGDLRFNQNGENLNALYDTDEFAEDNSSSFLGGQISSTSNIGSDSLGSNSSNLGSGNSGLNSSLPNANSNRGLSGKSTPNKPSPNNNHGQTSTTNTKANNTTPTIRRTPETEKIARMNEEQRRQIEQNQNVSPQIVQPQANPSAPSTNNKSRREEIEAKRRKREEEHPRFGKVMNRVGMTKDGAIDKAVRVKAGAGALADNYVNNAKKSITKSLKEGRPGKAVSRAIGGAVGAATFGTIGVAAGVASGDMKSVMTDGIAGVAGGYKVGTGVGNVIDNVAKTDEVAETFLKGYYGEKGYREKLVEENQKAKQLSPATIKRIQDKTGMSRKEAEKYATQNQHNYYMQNKIDDVDDWIVLDKLIDKDNGPKMIDKDGHVSSKNYDMEMAVTMHKLIKRTGMESKNEKETVDMLMSILSIDRKEAQWYYNNMRPLENIMNG